MLSKNANNLTLLLNEFKSSTKYGKTKRKLITCKLQLIEIPQSRKLAEYQIREQNQISRIINFEF